MVGIHNMTGWHRPTIINICLILTLIITIIFLHQVDAQPSDCKVFPMTRTQPHKLPMPHGNFGSIAYDWRYVLEVRVRNNKKKYVWTSIDITDPFCEYDNNNGKLKRKKCYNSGWDVNETVVNIENKIVIGGSFQRSMESYDDYVVLLQIGWTGPNPTWVNGKPIANNLCISTPLNNNRYNHIPYIWKHRDELKDVIPWLNNQHFPENGDLGVTTFRSMKWQVKANVFDGFEWFRKTIDLPAQQHNCFISYDSGTRDLKLGSCTYRSYTVTDNAKGDFMITNPWVQIKITKTDLKYIDNVALYLAVLDSKNTTWDSFHMNDDLNKALLSAPLSEKLTINRLHTNSLRFGIGNKIYGDGFVPIEFLSTNLPYPFPTSQYLHSAAAVKWRLGLKVSSNDKWDTKKSGNASWFINAEHTTSTILELPNGKPYCILDHYIEPDPAVLIKLFCPIIQRCQIPKEPRVRCFEKYPDISELSKGFKSFNNRWVEILYSLPIGVEFDLQLLLDVDTKKTTSRQWPSIHINAETAQYLPPYTSSNTQIDVDPLNKELIVKVQDQITTTEIFPPGDYLRSAKDIRWEMHCSVINPHSHPGARGPSRFMVLELPNNMNTQPGEHYTRCRLEITPHSLKLGKCQWLRTYIEPWTWDNPSDVVIIENKWVQLIVSWEMNREYAPICETILSVQFGQEGYQGRDFIRIDSTNEQQIITNGLAKSKLDGSSYVPRFQQINMYPTGDYLKTIPGGVKWMIHLRIPRDNSPGQDPNVGNGHVVQQIEFPYHPYKSWCRLYYKRDSIPYWYGCEPGVFNGNTGITSDWLWLGGNHWIQVLSHFNDWQHQSLPKDSTIVLTTDSTLPGWDGLTVDYQAPREVRDDDLQVIGYETGAQGTIQEKMTKLNVINPQTGQVRDEHKPYPISTYLQSVSELRWEVHADVETSVPTDNTPVGIILPVSTTVFQPQVLAFPSTHIQRCILDLGHGGLRWFDCGRREFPTYPWSSPSDMVQLDNNWLSIQIPSFYYQHGIRNVKFVLTANLHYKHNGATLSNWDSMIIDDKFPVIDNKLTIIYQAKGYFHVWCQNKTLSKHITGNTNSTWFNDDIYPYPIGPYLNNTTELKWQLHVDVEQSIANRYQLQTIDWPNDRELKHCIVNIVDYQVNFAYCFKKPLGIAEKNYYVILQNQWVSVWIPPTIAKTNNFAIVLAGGSSPWVEHIQRHDFIPIDDSITKTWGSALQLENVQHFNMFKHSSWNYPYPITRDEWYINDVRFQADEIWQLYAYIKQSNGEYKIQKLDWQSPYHTYCNVNIIDGNQLQWGLCQRQKFVIDSKNFEIIENQWVSIRISKSYLTTNIIKNIQLVLQTRSDLKNPIEWFPINNKSIVISRWERDGGFFKLTLNNNQIWGGNEQYPNGSYLTVAKEIQWELRFDIPNTHNDNGWETKTLVWPKHRYRRHCYLALDNELNAYWNNYGLDEIIDDTNGKEWIHCQAEPFEDNDKSIYILQNNWISLQVAKTDNFTKLKNIGLWLTMFLPTSLDGNLQRDAIRIDEDFGKQLANGWIIDNNNGRLQITLPSSPPVVLGNNPFPTGIYMTTAKNMRWEVHINILQQTTGLLKFEKISFPNDYRFPNCILTFRNSRVFWESCQWDKFKPNDNDKFELYENLWISMKISKSDYKLYQDPKLVFVADLTVNNNNGDNTSTNTDWFYVPDDYGKRLILPGTQIQNDNGFFNIIFDGDVTQSFPSGPYQTIYSTIKWVLSYEVFIWDIGYELRTIDWPNNTNTKQNCQINIQSTQPRWGECSLTPYVEDIDFAVITNPWVSIKISKGHFREINIGEDWEKLINPTCGKQVCPYIRNIQFILSVRMGNGDNSPWDNIVIDQKLGDKLKSSSTMIEVRDKKLYIQDCPNEKC